MNNNLILGLLLFVLSLLTISCTSDTKSQSEEQAKPEPTLVAPSISFVPTGRAKGKLTQMYVLRNGNGISVEISNYGGIITSIKTPDKDGHFEEISLGFDSLNNYLSSNPYFGAIIGRYGNRIAKGQFTLEGKTYALAKNNGENHLHGGSEGFDKVVWEPTVTEKADGVPVLRLRYTSPDGEEGYPGNLSASVEYSLNNKNELSMEYTARTDKTTIVNLTNHAYFNLTGNAKRDVLDHQLTLNADEFLPVDKTLIPIGELRAVEGTPFDFRRSTAIGERIAAENEQIQVGGGYDHCWVLNRPFESEELIFAAKVLEPTSGRTLEVYTTEPGIQFYSGNFLDGSLTGIGGAVYEKRFALCLETEHFPDSPNQPKFPSTVLKPGERYKTSTIYKFGVE